MKQLLTILVITVISGKAQVKFQPPVTASIPVQDTLHGVILTDSYRWLENKTDPKVIEWTKAQHDYGIQYLSETQNKHDGLKKDIADIIDMDFEGPLNKQGKRVFQTIKRKGDKQYKIYTILNGNSVLIWDPVKLDSSGNISTQSVNYTYDGERAAINTQKSGAEISTTYIIETRTGKILFPPLENIFGFQWTKDQQHAYFTLRTQEDVDKQLPLKTYLWKVGDPANKARFIGTTSDAKNSFFIYDNRYSDVSFYGESDFYSNKAYLFKTGTSDKGLLIYNNEKSNAYPEAIGDKLFIFTNDNAPNYRLMVANINNPAYKNWKTLIPESKSVMQGYIVTKHNIIIQDKKDIQSRLTLYDMQGKKIRELALPETGNVADISYDREEDSVYITLNTFTSMPKIFVASAKDFKWKLFYQRKVSVDMSNITGEIKFYTSKDGTKIPAFVLHRKDIKMDGNNPVLLTAYGGFQSGIQPHYYGFFASLINRGVIFVEAGIRGGDEYGEQWHRDGMLNKKQNCFDDFYSCAEWLINEKYTNTDKIVAMGGSNGGLLMGAAATQRPDLFKAIVCEVPLLDMLRYDKFLIARYWIPEYGTADSAKDFRWLLRYSPYQNIRKGVNIPTMLVTAGANDSRVDPMNAKKFVAAAQNNDGQVSPIILHMDYNSGHGSGQSTEQSIENWDFVFEFILNQLNI
ncbi:MAG: S9 family peptidase [Bacteroidetes bacterium]|nr:S9 family peptidase [Bacteroidota bacterium]MBS1930741.1 S9 family peptidase [Bacteroidota bacterium]